MKFNQLSLLGLIFKSNRFCLALSVLAFGFSGTVNALVISGSSLGFGESVNITLSIGQTSIPISSGPLPVASGLAPIPYNETDSVLSESFNDPIFQNITRFSTDQMLANANSDVDGGVGDRFSSADATVNNLLIDLASPIPMGPISFVASTVQSSASVSGDINNFIVNGTSALVEAILNINGNQIPVSSTPLANTTVHSEPGLSVILNEQIVVGDGIVSRGIEVNAVHIIFDNFFLFDVPNAGPAFVDGDIRIAHSEASLTAVIEPGAFLLFMSGLAGLVFWRKNSSS